MSSFLYGAAFGFIVSYLLVAAAWGRLFTSVLSIEMTGYQVFRAAILWPAAMAEIGNRRHRANASPTPYPSRTSH
jgi:hypothetical protein